MLRILSDMWAIRRYGHHTHAREQLLGATGIIDYFQKSFAFSLTNEFRSVTLLTSTTTNANNEDNNDTQRIEIT